MILSQALRGKPSNQTTTGIPLTEMVQLTGGKTLSGQVVTPERSRTVATAYRCGNIISDDVGKMPLQVFKRNNQGNVEQVKPDARGRNLAYQIQISPNQWLWTPFLFKKVVIQWMIYWGNAYIWSPPTWPPQKLVLPADVTWPVFDLQGNLWYRTQFANMKVKYLPSWEVLHLLINPDKTGFEGRSVITYAAETLGRQLGAHETESRFYAQGLNAAGLLWTAGEVDKPARQKIRDAYEEAMSGSENAYRIAVMDPKITKFEQVTMKASDMQFLESIQATDQDICNFFGLPLFKLNAGKQSYQSNEQQNLDYLSTTLDPYLVQWEESGRLLWLAQDEQSDTQLHFIREALLRTDSKTRAEYNEILIRSGQRSPNEVREKDDFSPYEGGENFYMASNYSEISQAAALVAAAKGGK